jgi:hypothetical protein
MPKPFDRDALLDAFDDLACAAVAAGVRLEIVVYGGPSLMLASGKGWSPEWLNHAVEFHLSPLATRGAEHVEFGTFPRAMREYLARASPAEFRSRNIFTEARPLRRKLSHVMPLD